MDYGSFAHLFLANPQLLVAIKKEYGPDVYMDDGAVINPEWPSNVNVMAYVDLTPGITGDAVTVLPLDESRYNRIDIFLEK